VVLYEIYSVKSRVTKCPLTVHLKHHLTCFNNIFSNNELISNRFAVFATCTHILTYLWNRLLIDFYLCVYNRVCKVPRVLFKLKRDQKFDLLMIVDKKTIFISKRVLKGVQILIFCIFGRCILYICNMVFVFSSNFYLLFIPFMVYSIVLKFENIWLSGTLNIIRKPKKSLFSKRKRAITHER
jgi:hypothetical protein